MQKNMTLEKFLSELESHCQSSAIATFMGSDGETFVIDLNRQKDQVIYGYHRRNKALFINKLLKRTNLGGSLVLRSFTSEIDELTQLPIKELRGYVLQSDGNQFEFEKLSPESMFACQNTDAETGEPLSLEQSVRYC